MTPNGNVRVRQNLDRRQVKTVHQARRAKPSWNVVDEDTDQVLSTTTHNIYQTSTAENDSILRQLHRAPNLPAYIFNAKQSSKPKNNFADTDNTTDRDYLISGFDDLPKSNATITPLGGEKRRPSTMADCIREIKTVQEHQESEFQKMSLEGTKRFKYNKFLAKLSPVLTSIEEKYNFDDAHLFLTHKENLVKFGCEEKVVFEDRKTREAHEKRSLDVFKEAIREYKNEGKRTEFVDNILTNYGLGPSSSTRVS